jgi:hypothetical protein
VGHLNFVVSKTELTQISRNCIGSAVLPDRFAWAVTFGEQKLILDLAQKRQNFRNGRRLMRIAPGNSLRNHVLTLTEHMDIGPVVICSIDG